MDSGAFYKHVSKTDVCCCVQRAKWWAGKLYVRGWWINIAMGDPFVICKEQIRILAKDVYKWKRVA